MNEQSNKWDRQWSQLLTRCHGETVDANPAFKTNLLGELKRKTTQNRQDAGAEEAAEDRNWSRLLAAAHGTCEADSMFRDRLLTQLKRKQAETAAAHRAEEADDALKLILTKTYTPVSARKEFQTRLFNNMRERQHDTVIRRRASRRRTVFLSALSSLSAAALVMFAVWINPMLKQDAAPMPPPGGEMALAVMQEMPSVAEKPARSFDGGNTFASFVDTPSHPDSSAMNVIPAAAAAGLALASAGSYKVADAFAGQALPGTVRGIGVEVDDGSGWQAMDAGHIAQVKSGMAFRPQPAMVGTTGLGFGDGSTMLLYPDTEVVATDAGFSVRQGTLAVTVPENSEDRFRLHFPERDIAVERGTMVAVSMESPAKYAEGGAPAPVVRVADGGMAVARGKNGSGVLLANHSYRIDNYVTADLPARSLCASECEDLEKSLRIQPAPARTGGAVSPNLLVSGENLPSYRSSAAQPAGFTKKDNRWVAAGYTNQPLVRIKYLSDDYFGFANERRDLSPALALGSEVILDGGDGTFYEIYK